MKNNLFLRIALLMLVATISMSAVFMGSGTVAKYYAQSEASASGRVALFKVSVTDKDDELKYVTNGEAATINLGTVLKEAQLGANENASGVVHVEEVDCSMIAPGTSSATEVLVTNESEVAIYVWLEAGTAVSGDIAATANIEFTGDGSTWRSTLAAALLDGPGSYGTAVYLEPGEYHTFTGIGWSWPFGSPGGTPDAQDTADTGLGKLGSEYLNIPLKIMVEQVD